MNVGFSIFDFVAVPAYAWRVYRACRSSSEEFKSVAAEVASLHVVLKETEEYVSERGASLGSDREAQLMVLEKECRGVLQDLETLLLRYESLGTQTQRTWDRMRWGSEDISAARQRLSTCTSLLTSFNLNLVKYVGSNYHINREEYADAFLLICPVPPWQGLRQNSTSSLPKYELAGAIVR
jgi:hypothetical protein